MTDDAPAPVAPIDQVAARMAEVSPAWAAVVDAAGATAFVAPGALGRDLALGVELVREGWLLHRGASRLAPSASPDLALLVGDWCYADGLCTVAEHGTLDDVATLAALIADVAAAADRSTDELEPRWAQAVSALAR